jgi:hypothetical protein
MNYSQKIFGLVKELILISEAYFYETISDAQEPFWYLFLLQSIFH